MSDFLLLPDGFLKYVTTFKRLPITPDADLVTLRALVETVCLEASMECGSTSSR